LLRVKQVNLTAPAELDSLTRWEIDQYNAWWITTLKNKDRSEIYEYVKKYWQKLAEEA
jgi:hypothetical protein